MLIIISFLKIKPKIFIWLFVLFFYFDLSRYFLKYNTFIDQNFIFPKTPAIEFLEQDKDIFRIGRLSREVLTPNTWIQYKLSSVEGYDPLALENYSRFFNRVNQNKYSDPINRYSELYTPDINFLSALNVKYLLSVENEKNAPSSFVKKYNLQPIFRDKSTVIYKNNNYLPRVYFVEKTTLFDDKEELTERLNGLDFNPLKETLVLSNKAESRNDWSVGNVTLKELKNNSMSIETDNKNDGFLVISNAYHPGWHIYIDNIEKEMYEVNGGLCGTYVPQGKHIVTAKYWPKSVEIGIKVSLISTFSAIILSLYLFFKSHK